MEDGCFKRVWVSGWGRGVGEVGGLFGGIRNWTTREGRGGGQILLKRGGGGVGCEGMEMLVD